MRNKAFHRLLRQVNTLTPTQSKQLQNQLNQKCSIKTLDDTTGEVSHCPHCGTTSVYKWGYRSGLQRYKCKDNALNKTPLARLRHKEVWEKYMQDLING